MASILTEMLPVYKASSISQSQTCSVNSCIMLKYKHTPSDISLACKTYRWSLAPALGPASRWLSSAAAVCSQSFSLCCLLPPYVHLAASCFEGLCHLHGLAVASLPHDHLFWGLPLLHGEAVQSLPFHSQSHHSMSHKGLQKAHLEIQKYQNFTKAS